MKVSYNQRIIAAFFISSREKAKDLKTNARESYIVAVTDILFILRVRNRSVSVCKHAAEALAATAEQTVGGQQFTLHLTTRVVLSLCSGSFSLCVCVHVCVEAGGWCQGSSISLYLIF